MRVHLQDQHVAAHLPRDDGNEQADRTTADDHDPLTDHEGRTTHVVHRDGGWLDKSCIAQRHAFREADQQTSRDRPRLLHRTRRVDADEDEPLADVAVPGKAGGTLTAPLQRHDRDRVSLGPVRHARTDLDDATRHLVTDDRRCADAVIHRSVQDVQVGPADTGVRNRDAHLTGARWHEADLDDVDRPVAEIPRRNGTTHSDDASCAQASPSG